MSTINHQITRISETECNLVNGGNVDGFGPHLPPQKPDNGIDPVILDQLRRIRMYGGV